MTHVDAFERHAEEYDAWFDVHRAAFESEVAAVRELLPECGTGLEIGTGTGRFAEALGVRFGVEPSDSMRRMARRRGVDVVEGVAENLPFDDARFDCALMITVDCFLDDVAAACAEAYRVLRQGGAFIVGMLDRDSPLGRRIAARPSKGPFFEHARLHAPEEITAAMDSTGFVDLAVRQTIFGDPASMRVPDDVRPGHGTGGFVVIRGMKSPPA